MNNLLVTAVLSGVFCLTTSFPAWSKPRVEMELVFEPGFPINGAQPWIKTLENVGVENLRIRQGREGDRTEIQTSGAGDSAVHRVTGILSGENKLVLPAGSFSLQDKARIAEWVEKIKAGGIEELTAPRTAFGLTEKEFLALHEKFAATVALSTKERPAADSIKPLVRGLGLPVAIDADARAALESDWQMPEELQGMSQGAGLAALLRPLGLGFAPERETGGKISLRISKLQEGRETWPVGWPPDNKPQEAMPDLFKFLNVEIADTPLPDALGAIQSRLKAPFLYDHNKIARERIELAAIHASFPAKRTYYKRIVDHLLIQAKLKAEVRVDEAGAPFLWITSIKK